MQFEAILSDLNFQSPDKTTWQRLRSFKQDCLSLKMIYGNSNSEQENVRFQLSEILSLTEL